jgi:hypothetical protein
MALTFVGQMPRLRVALSRALPILLNCRGAGRGARRRLGACLPHHKISPSGKSKWQWEADSQKTHWKMTRI